MSVKKVKINGELFEVPQPAMRNNVHILWVRFTPKKLTKIEKLYHKKLKDEGLTPRAYGWGTFVRDLAMAQVEQLGDP